MYASDLAEALLPEAIQFGDGPFAQAIRRAYQILHC